MYLSQGNNIVMPVRLDPATPLSQVKHSTTEPPILIKVFNGTIYDIMSFFVGKIVSQNAAFHHDLH